MSEHQLINFHIRTSKRLTRIFNRLTKAERRQVIEIAQGDADHLEEIFEFVLEGRKRK